MSDWGPDVWILLALAVVGVVYLVGKENADWLRERRTPKEKPPIE